MCGLIAAPGRLAATLEPAVKAVGRRGPHSHGWAWAAAGRVTGRGRLSLATLPPEAFTADWVIGHSRLATDTARHGALPDPGEGQPLTRQSVILAHNGHAATLTGHAAPSDSRTLLDWIAHDPVRLLSLDDSAPQAALFTVNGTLWAWRHDGKRYPAHPLYVQDGPIVSSVPTGPATLLPVGITHIE